MGSVDSKLLLGADSDRKIDFKPEPEMEDLTADFDVDVSALLLPFLPSLQSSLSLRRQVCNELY